MDDSYHEIPPRRFASNLVKIILREFVPEELPQWGFPSGEVSPTGKFPTQYITPQRSPPKQEDLQSNIGYLMVEGSVCIRDECLIRPFASNNKWNCIINLRSIISIWMTGLHRGYPSNLQQIQYLLTGHPVSLLTVFKHTWPITIQRFKHIYI